MVKNVLTTREHELMKSEKDILKIRKVMVAVDGSESSAKAVKVAAEIAKNNSAELTILHVMTVPYSAFSGDVPLPLSQIEKDARHAGDKYVTDAVNSIKTYGIKPKTEMIEWYDSPVKGITQFAEKHDIDLIVVGTRGLGGFKRLVLGSVASGVVHYARCSVTVVR